MRTQGYFKKLVSQGKERKEHLLAIVEYELFGVDNSGAASDRPGNNSDSPFDVCT